jgi:xylan 1,4-beta-xylosidase
MEAPRQKGDKALDQSNLVLPLLVILISITLNPDKSVSAQTKNGYTNPILAGFYPDPSICKVGDNFYLVTSTFSYFPGLPVMHSKDLVHWTQIGSVLNRPEQLNLDRQGVSQGLFAPSIRYHAGLFYVTCTLVNLGGNFVVTAEDPSGPWSNPVWIPQIDGIDPSPFFDDDGKAYIVYNSAAPDNKPLYDGHRTIRMYEFDPNLLKVKGRERILVNGGTDLSKKPIWIEAPHIFRKDNYYYLICAEGGTADLHSEVVFRGKDAWGPYESYKGNPVLTQRDLPIPRENPVTTAGHADFVQTQTGEWWAVFLACRPYRLLSAQHEYYNTGRETWLARVVWKDGWPLIDLGGPEVKYRYPAPNLPEGPKPRIPLSGNFTYRDEFDKTILGQNWMFLRTPHEKWYSLTEKPGTLVLRLRPETASGNMNPTFLGHRQQHLRGSASVAMEFTPAAENEKAGLLIFQSEPRYYLLCKSIEGEKPVVQLYRSALDDPKSERMELLGSEELPGESTALYLKIEAKSDIYAFQYAVTPEAWRMLKDSVDATSLNTRYPQGFVGCMYALYATSLGKPSETSAYFDWFEYVGDDEVYR